MELQDFSSKFVPAIDTWNQLMGKVNLKTAKMEFVDNSSENPHINYFRYPISGVRELERLMDSIESKLVDIKSKALVIQSRKDPVVSNSGTKKNFGKLGYEIKEYFLYDFNRHGILLGKDSIRIYKAIADFIELL